MKTDVLIVGSGCSALYMALHLSEDLNILMVTKKEAELSDSFLAQGGICMLRNEDDYDSYFEDTMKAGHYENDAYSVELMIKSSPDVIQDLISYGVDFERNEDGSLAFTREGAHSQKRILYHEDITGKEITRHLLEKVRQKKNVTLLENTPLVDLIVRGNVALGGVIKRNNQEEKVYAKKVVLATGGIGGLYKHSTNYPHLTGDGIELSNNLTESQTKGVSGGPSAPYGRYGNIFLSQTEYDELQAEYPDRLERFIEEMSRYLAANGKSYQNYAAALRIWAGNDKKEAPKKGIPDYSCKEGESL